MSAHLTLPRVGHLEALYWMFGCLTQQPKRKLGFDAQHPMINEKYSRNMFFITIGV